MFGSREKLLERAERLFDPQRAPKFQGTRPITLDDVLATGRTITADYGRIEATFRKAFPDYRCETPITFGISLYMFDGNQSSDTPGKSQMRFGVEMSRRCTRRRNCRRSSITSCSTSTRRRRSALQRRPVDTQPVWWALWNEGLATYVSWKLNPTLTAPEIFWMPRDMETQMQPKLAEAARLMLADLDGHEGYGRWFMGGSNPPGLP